MLNKVMIIGRLGRDPELRYSQGGAPVCNMTVATDESYQDRDGNKIERTEWHRVIVFQRVAENCANYLSKGSLVFVEGSLQTRKWTDQQGIERYTTEIKAQRVQFLERKNSNPRPGDEEDYAASPRQAPSQPQQQAAARQRTPQEDLGPAFPSEASNLDEVPF